jgi:hypothetical protein
LTSAEPPKTFQPDIPMRSTPEQRTRHAIILATAKLAMDQGKPLVVQTAGASLTVGQDETPQLLAIIAKLKAENAQLRSDNEQLKASAVRRAHLDSVSREGGRLVKAEATMLDTAGHSTWSPRPSLLSRIKSVVGIA